MLNVAHYQRNANQNYNEVSPHIGQNGHHQKNLQTINARRMWRKGNPLALLMGMKIDTAIMENTMESPKNLKIKPPYDPAIPLLGTYPEKILIQNDQCSLQHCL